MNRNFGFVFLALSLIGCIPKAPLSTQIEKVVFTPARPAKFSFFLVDKTADPKSENPLTDPKPVLEAKEVESLTFLKHSMYPLQDVIRDALRRYLLLKTSDGSPVKKPALIAERISGGRIVASLGVEDSKNPKAAAEIFRRMAQ